MISLQHLTKQFGQLIAVDDLCLEIAKGEFFAFLGPNAAGKTTTLKLMVGLLKPTRGCVCIGGYDIQGPDYLQAKGLLSYIPDVVYLYDKLTAFEFLYFIGKLYKFSAAAIEKKAEKLLDTFGLLTYRHQLIEGFSHGMRQRLAMCAAFLHEPQLILIDEPFVGLDPYSTKLLKGILKSSSASGTTIFISTHTLSIAEELADRIGIIDRARLVALGTMQELKKLSGIAGHLEEVFLKLTHEEHSSANSAR